jgi:hypothetical protein
LGALTLNKVIPIFISHNLQATIAFYSKLGFEINQDFIGRNYLIAKHLDIEFHFQLDCNFDPKCNYNMCYIRSENAQFIFDNWNKIGLKKNGIPRLENYETKPWGMKEFAIIDPSGTLIRIGKINE